MSRRLQLVELICSEWSASEEGKQVPRYFPVPAAIDPGMVTFIREPLPDETKKGMGCVVIMGGQSLGLVNKMDEVLAWAESGDTGLSINPKEL